jgi:hypothetical protein
MSMLDEPVPQDDLMRDRTRIFEEFLISESPIYNYRDDIARILRTEQRASLSTSTISATIIENSRTAS